MPDLDTTQELAEAVIGKLGPLIAGGFPYSPPANNENPIPP